MRTYRLYQVDSFTRTPLLGNPAGVVANADGLNEEEMRQIARELNNSETAFLFTPIDNTHDVWVRFFTPQTEVPICGHATIAAHYVRALEGDMPTCRVLQKTGAGVLPVNVVRTGDSYRIVMTQGTVEFGAILEGETVQLLCEALGISQSDLRGDCPVQIVSTGHSKVMVGLREQALLHRLQPDAGLLCRVSTLIRCNGFYTFTLHAEETHAVHGRMFAPAIGIAEDPITGNANGPLGAYLAHYCLLPVHNGELRFTAMQGEAMRRPGTMEVAVMVENGQPVTVRIAGDATVVFATTITLGDR